MRSGEAWRLEWIDFDFENRTVRDTPEKGGNPRVLRTSNKLLAMLSMLPRDSPKPFKGSLRHFARTFRRQRKKATYKLQSTLIYTHLVKFEDDKFTCRVARTLKEAESLIEAGFDYVTDMDGVKLFRKRK